MDTTCTILVAGGCEVYAESELVLSGDGGRMRASLRRLTPHGHYLDEAGEEIPDFATGIDPGEAEALLAALARAVGEAPAAGCCTTADLSLEVTGTGGWAGHTRTLVEGEDAPDLEAVLAPLEAFVARLGRRARP